jgi:hypothetical protein
MERYDAHLTEKEKEAVAASGFICLSDSLPEMHEIVQVLTDIRSEPVNYLRRRQISKVIPMDLPRIRLGALKDVNEDGYAEFSNLGMSRGFLAMVDSINYPTHWKPLEKMPYSLPENFLDPLM